MGIASFRLLTNLREGRYRSTRLNLGIINGCLKGSTFGEGLEEPPLVVVKGLVDPHRFSGTISTRGMQLEA